MESVTLSALAAMGGSAVGALASIVTTWLTQHHQSETRRRAQEHARRERLFGEFITQASAMYAHALTHDRLDPAALVSLQAVKSQLGLFSTQATLERAEDVMKLIVDTHYLPNVDFSSREALQSGHGSFLRPFTEAARRELD